MSESSDGTSDSERFDESETLGDTFGGLVSDEHVHAAGSSDGAPHAEGAALVAGVYPTTWFPKTWRSEAYGVVIFAAMIVGGIVMSHRFSGLVIEGPVVTLGTHRIWLSLPILWLIPAWWLVTLIFRVYNVRYSADARGLESVEGVLSFNQTITRVRYGDVRSLELDQTILERILDVGELEVGTAGTAGVEMIFKGVAEPFAIKKLIQSRRDIEENSKNIMTRLDPSAP